MSYDFLERNSFDDLWMGYSVQTILLNLEPQDRDVSPMIPVLTIHGNGVVPYSVARQSRKRRDDDRLEVVMPMV